MPHRPRVPLLESSVWTLAYWTTQSLHGTCPMIPQLLWMLWIVTGIPLLHMILQMILITTCMVCIMMFMSKWSLIPLGLIEQDKPKFNRTGSSPLAILTVQAPVLQQLNKTFLKKQPNAPRVDPQCAYFIILRRKCVWQSIVALQGERRKFLQRPGHQVLITT